MSSYRPLKHFGQHLLNNIHYLEKILNALAPQKQDLLVEVGPGMGALTKVVLPYCNHLHVVEIDKRFIEYLELNFDASQLTVHGQSALDFDFNSLITDERKIRILGNLPYNISTPLIFHFLEFKNQIQDMLFLLQTEVVDRMAAPPGDKTYGRLSVMVQYHCHVHSLFHVPPSAFTPPPKVNSSVVQLTPYQRNDIALNYNTFKNIVNAAFQQRRKTISNALHAFISKPQLIAIEIDPQQRAETLSVEDYVRISNLVL